MKKTNAGIDTGRGARRARFVASLALAFGLATSPFACRRSDDGPRGQSGSEAPAGTGGTDGTDGDNDQSPPCPCGAPGVFLRVTVLESRGAQRTLRVEQLIHGETTTAPGDELVVEDTAQPPCFVGSLPVADGQQALAVFSPADPADCGAPDCGGIDGSVRLAPWDDRAGADVPFAQVGDAAIRVPAAELDSLWSDDVDACISRRGDVWLLLEAASPEDDAGDP